MKVTATTLEAQIAGKAQRSPRTFRFKHGETVVENGVFKRRNGRFAYAAVPLCHIKSGAVNILEYGKAIKRLQAGEYFGLFETAHALRFKNNKRIGRWTLVADGATSVVPLSLPQCRGAQCDIETLTVENHVPKTLTRLPVLDAFANSLNIEPIDDTVLIYHSHLLESSYDLVKHLGALFGYRNTFVVEKPYSTVDSAFMKIARTGVRTYAVPIEEHLSHEFSVRRSVDFVWDVVAHHARHHPIRKIIILSDGGDFLLDVPWEKLHGVEVVGVEQTQHGVERVRHHARTPAVVNVASSPAKKVREAPYIAKAVFEKMRSLQLIGVGHTFGVVGHGAIGGAITRLLASAGEQYIHYDRSVRETNTVQSLEALIERADVILGTTGTDALRGLFIEKLHGRKIAISASSSNIEFAYLFDLAKKYANKFEDVALAMNGDLQFKVLNGGYPINFDREKEWEPLEDIQLTRTLLYAGVVQALQLEDGKRGIIHALNRNWQKQIVSLWKEQSRTSAKDRREVSQQRRQRVRRG